MPIGGNQCRSNRHRGDERYPEQRVLDGEHVPAEGVVDVHVTMTSAACPVADVIVHDIETELDRALPADLRIHVELVWEPEWTPRRMSATARRFMGW